MNLPPILQIPGMKLIEIGEDDTGAYLKFASTRRKVREVTVYMLAHGPVRWRYVYSVWDEHTRTVVTHEGSTGDPEKDPPVDMRGV